MVIFRREEDPWGMRQQCGYDVVGNVGRDRREIRTLTCSVYGHWQIDNETVVILQSLSCFSDGPDTADSIAVDLWWHVETRLHLPP